MSAFEAFLLGILQGVTEFLPISSSGHLVIAEKLLGLNVSDLVSFDVFVHVGTLVAILFYFKSDFTELLMVTLAKAGGLHLSDEQSEKFKMVKYLALAMIPAVVFGVLFQDVLESTFRLVEYVGTFMIAVGIFFMVSESVSHSRIERVDSWKKALIIGLFQAVALLPGVSRSGLTISGGLVCGLKREEAARFSFLLGAIAIFGAFVYKFQELVSPDMRYVPVSALLIGFISSFISGLLSVRFLMKFLKNNSLRVFSVYLMVVGGGILFMKFL